MWKISLSWIFASALFGATGFDAVPRGLAHGTVSQLPTASSWTNTLFLVTDGASASDCTTGSGSTRVLCVSNGSAWIGAGGSGGSGNCSVAGSTNVLQKNGGSSNCAASSITDNGTTVVTTEPFQAASVCSGASCPAVTPGTGGVVAGPEGTVPTVCAASAVDCLYFDSTRHGPLLSVNGGSYLSLPTTPAATTSGNIPTYSDTVGNIGAGITPGTGVATFITTPSSANLAAAITDETGSGATVFANTPTLVTPVLGVATGTSIALGGSTNACTGGTAGCGQFDQGTAPSGLPSNGIQDIAPTSVTSYRDTRPGTVGSTGVDLVSVSGTVATHTYGPLTASLIPNTTASNCSNAASPAVCGSAAAGAVALPTGITSVTLVVNTSLVTANSEIFLQSDDSLTIAATTCNSTLATLVGGLAVTARTPGTSFTITYNGTIATNPLCVAYRLVN